MDLTLGHFGVHEAGFSVGERQLLGRVRMVIVPHGPPGNYLSAGLAARRGSVSSFASRIQR